MQDVMTINDLDRELLHMVMQHVAAPGGEKNPHVAAIIPARHVSALWRTTADHVIPRQQDIGEEPTTLLGEARRFIKRVVRSGRLDLLQWAQSQGAPLDKRLCSLAALCGRLDVIEWARRAGCRWGKSTCAAAARGGHLDVLQWARAHGCPWDQSTCSNAAKGGHLDVLRWARANGCPWGERTCMHAAMGGRIDMLQWARANGCPWDAWACSKAEQHDLLW